MQIDAAIRACFLSAIAAIPGMVRGVSGDRQYEPEGDIKLFQRMQNVCKHLFNHTISMAGILRLP